MEKTLSQEQLLERVKPLMPKYGRLFRKKTNVLAKTATGDERIETITGDGKETANTAKAGEFLVRNQTKAGELYVVKPEHFHKKYKYLGEREDGYAEYKAVGEVNAMALKAETLRALDIEAPFHFVASWGEEMVAKPDDFLVIPTGGQEVYRIARQEFWETYEPKPE